MQVVRTTIMDAAFPRREWFASILSPDSSVSTRMKCGLQGPVALSHCGIERASVELLFGSRSLVDSDQSDVLLSRTVTS